MTIASPKNTLKAYLNKQFSDTENIESHWHQNIATAVRLLTDRTALFVTPDGKDFFKEHSPIFSLVLAIPFIEQHDGLYTKPEDLLGYFLCNDTLWGNYLTKLTLISNLEDQDAEDDEVLAATQDFLLKCARHTVSVYTTYFKKLQKEDPEYGAYNRWKHVRMLNLHKMSFKACLSLINSEMQGQFSYTPAETDEDDPEILLTDIVTTEISPTGDDSNSEIRSMLEKLNAMVESSTDEEDQEFLEHLTALLDVDLSDEDFEAAMREYEELEEKHANSDLDLRDLWASAPKIGEEVGEYRDKGFDEEKFVEHFEEAVQVNVAPFSAISIMNRFDDAQKRLDTLERLAKHVSYDGLLSITDRTKLSNILNDLTDRERKTLCQAYPTLKPSIEYFQNQPAPKISSESSLEAVSSSDSGRPDSNIQVVGKVRTKPRPGIRNQDTSRTLASTVPLKPSQAFDVSKLAPANPGPTIVGTDDTEPMNHLHRTSSVPEPKPSYKVSPPKLNAQVTIDKKDFMDILKQMISDGTLQVSLPTIVDRVDSPDSEQKGFFFKLTDFEENGNGDFDLTFEMTNNPEFQPASTELSGLWKSDPDVAEAFGMDRQAKTDLFGENLIRMLGSN